MTSCCKDVHPNQSSLGEGIPDTTFMCLARMSYELTAAAEKFYTGRERTPWAEVPDAECMLFAASIRRMLSGYPPAPGGDQFYHLAYHMLHSLVTHV